MCYVSPNKIVIIVTKCNYVIWNLVQFLLSSTFSFTEEKPYHEHRNKFIECLVILTYGAAAQHN